MYRDELASGMRTLWVEAIVSPSQRSLHASIWNPDRRATKALFDISSGLALFVRDSPDSDAVQLTLPYLALLTFISNQARHLPDAVATQFMLLTDHGMDKPCEPAPVFLSHWHRL